MPLNKENETESNLFVLRLFFFFFGIHTIYFLFKSFFCITKSKSFSLLPVNYVSNQSFFAGLLRGTSRYGVVVNVLDKVWLGFMTYQPL